MFICLRMGTFDTPCDTSQLYSLDRTSVLSQLDYHENLSWKVSSHWIYFLEQIKLFCKLLWPVQKQDNLVANYPQLLISARVFLTSWWTFFNLYDASSAFFLCIFFSEFIKTRCQIGKMRIFIMWRTAIENVSKSNEAALWLYRWVSKPRRFWYSVEWILYIWNYLWNRLDERVSVDCRHYCLWLRRKFA